MCECGKNYKMAPRLTEAAPETWGPTFWKVLHLFASRIGKGDAMANTDAANAIFYVINQLHYILPCTECQKHTHAYLAEHKFDPRTASDLHTYVSQWLIDFHNAVRARKGQPILISTVAESDEVWRRQKILACDDKALGLYLDYGKTYKLIPFENYSRWIIQYKRLRLLLGL